MRRGKAQFEQSLETARQIGRAERDLQRRRIEAQAWDTIGRTFEGRRADAPASGLSACAAPQRCRHGASARPRMESERAVAAAKEAEAPARPIVNFYRPTKIDVGSVFLRSFLSPRLCRANLTVGAFLFGVLKGFWRLCHTAFGVCAILMEPLRSTGCKPPFWDSKSAMKPLTMLITAPSRTSARTCW